ncbi:syndecan-3 isoform X1 [Xenopus laevis]|uniref:Syndecan n=1 Tax=Xenopus laevis TaxID=8355 RepID=A0A8J0VDP3_XENLA|nr:syndecan-3 isoform X1 [Xenopus laevis]
MDKLLAALCMLGMCCSLVMTDVSVSSSPLDLEASGDDEDFSGSGIDAIDVNDALLKVPSTSVLPIFEQENTSPRPKVDEKYIAVEHTTRVVETTKPRKDPFEELVDPVFVAVGHDAESTSPEATTHKPTTHRPTTVKSTAVPMESITEQKHHPQHHHHHHHHHPHHHNHTTKPATSTDQHEDTSDSPSGEDKSYIHYIHRTTSPPDNEEPDLHKADHRLTTIKQRDPDEPVDHHIPDQDSPSGSSSTPYMEYEETTEDPSGAQVHNVLIGYGEKTTTNPSENEEDDGIFADNHEKPLTTSPSNEGVFHVQHGLDKTTSSPSHHAELDVEVHHSTTPAHINKHHSHHHHHTIPETTTSVNEEILDPVDDSTTPADLNKHDHHHHHHHPHHHTTPETTTSVNEEIPHPVDDSTTPADQNKHHHHHHHHHPHHHTTPETTTSVNEEIPHPVDDSTTPADLNKHHHHHHHHPHHHTTQETTTSVDEEIPHRVDDSTTPADLNKHHHHHHPHHHTTPETTTTTSSLTKHSNEVSTVVHKGRMAHGASATSAVPLFDENANIPELVDLPSHNTSVVSEEGDADTTEESSGLNEKNGFYFNDVIPKATAPPIHRMINNDISEQESTPDASHGIMERKEVLAGIIAGGVAGLAFAVFLVGFMLYRMKKKDEGSYSLEEPKQKNGGYQKPCEQREFYA